MASQWFLPAKLWETMLSSNMDSVISSPMEEAEDSSSSAMIGVAAATPAPSHHNRHESHRLPPLLTPYILHSSTEQEHADTY